MRSIAGLHFGGRIPAEHRDVRCFATTYIFFSTVLARACVGKEKRKCVALQDCISVAGYLRSKEMFIAKQ